MEFGSTGSKKRVYGYVRVSTTMQAEDGISLDNQRKKIKAWAEVFDHELVKIFSDEGITGRSIEKRAGLKELLQTIQCNEILVVYSFSRLSRSVKDFLTITTQLNERDCQIVILKEGLDTSTAHGKFSATLMSALAQLESDITSERVKDSMKYKADKGEFVGRPPYGWKLEFGKGSNLIEVPKEQAIIHKIKYLRDRTLTGDKKQLSFQKIADRLNNEHITPPGKSKEWYHTTVRRIYNRKPEEVITKGRDSKLDKHLTDNPKNSRSKKQVESSGKLIGNVKAVDVEKEETLQDKAIRARNLAMSKIMAGENDVNSPWLQIAACKEDKETLKLLIAHDPKWI